jgi:hypothetical protein
MAADGATDCEKQTAAKSSRKTKTKLFFIAKTGLIVR